MEETWRTKCIKSTKQGSDELSDWSSKHRADTRLQQVLCIHVIAFSLVFYGTPEYEGVGLWLLCLLLGFLLMLVCPILMWLFLFLTQFLFCKMAKKPWVNICFQLCLCVCAHACVYVCMHMCVSYCVQVSVCAHLCMCVLIFTPESNGSRKVVIWINNKFLILVSYSDPQRVMCLWIKLLSMLLIRG